MNLDQELSLKEKVLMHWDLINRLAAKRFSRESVSEAAALYVMDQLAEEDWKKIRQFTGRSRFVTYLSSVIYRLLEDYSRKRFGRKKIPVWITDMGGIWLSLFRLLCFERFPFDDAVRIAEDRNAGLQQKNIERAAEEILAKIPDCGDDQYKEVLYEEGGATADVEIGSSQQQDLEETQKEQLAGALFLELLGGTSDASESAVRSIIELEIDISAEERLLLKMCYRDGLNAAEAGRIIGLNRYQVHGRMRRLFTRIRQAFSDSGCEEEIRLLLKE